MWWNLRILELIQEDSRRNSKTRYVKLRYATLRYVIFVVQAIELEHTHDIEHYPLVYI